MRKLVGGLTPIPSAAHNAAKQRRREKLAKEAKQLEKLLRQAATPKPGPLTSALLRRVKKVEEES
jgi:hypothetical protein